MHILHLTPYYLPAYAFGGVARAAEGMAQALVQRGHRVTVLTTDALTQTERYTGAMDVVQDGVRVVRVRNQSVTLRGRYNLSTPAGLRQVADDLLSDVDVVHGHEWRTVENWRVLPVAGRHNKPVILSPHGTLTYETGRSALKSAWDALISPRLARYVTHIAALTTQEAQDVRQLWQRFGPMPPIDVIPNGIHTHEFAQLPDDKPLRTRYNIRQKRIVLFMGRLHARKGVDVLVQAFQQARVADTHLLIVGPDDGMGDQLNALIARTPDAISLTGYLDGQERLQAWAAADVFVLPATGEGLSMAVLEAMAAGLPVILSPGCNLPEVVDAGAGWVVEPAIDALANALTALFADEARLGQMAEAARAWVQARFTWARVGQQLEAVYRVVLGR